MKTILRFLVFLSLVLTGCNSAAPVPAATIMAPLPTQATRTPQPAIPTWATAFPALTDGYLFPAEIEDQKLMAAVQSALPELVGTASFGGRPFCAFFLLTQPRVDENGMAHVYTEYRCIEYYPVETGLEMGTGIDQPLVLTLEATAAGWQVSGYQTPTPGNWGPSIRAMFPEEAWPLLFPDGYAADNAHREAHRRLGEDVRQQAQDFYRLPVLPTP